MSGSSRAYAIWIASEARRKLKARAVAYKGGKCELCGYSKSLAAMEFHHRDPGTKDFKVSGTHRRWEAIRPELDKCTLLCANCHRELHDAEQIAKLDEQERRARLEVAARVARVVIPCALCGKDVETTASRRRSYNQTFCNNTCHGGMQEKAVWPPLEKLSEMVWQTPWATLARRLGVSVAAVKKRCRRLGVDTPPPGYWSSSERRVPS